LDPEIVVEALLSAYRAIQQHLPKRNLLVGLLDRANLAAPHRYPCGAGRHYMAVATDGRISACHMLLDYKPQQVMDVPPLVLDPLNKAVEVFNPSVGTKQACIDCSFRYWCAGSCPLTAYRATGRYDTKSPYCEIYKQLIPEVFRLEGYRLLRDRGHLFS
jgi:uncharacterized protein